MNMQQAPFPMQPMAEQMAQQGRYGDTMLVHMNPIEVEGLASLSPTGQLTTNPATGQPEAFLPILAAIASGVGGSALGGALAGGIGGLFGSTFAGTLAGKLGTLAAKGIATEGIRAGLSGDDFDPMKALTSAATTFGVDQAAKAAAVATNPDVLSATETATGLQEGLAGAEKALDASQKAMMALDKASPEYAEQLAKMKAAQGTIADLSTTQALPTGQVGPPMPSQIEMAQRGVSAATDAARANPFGSFGANPGEFAMEFGKGLMSPSAAIPIAVGEGQRAEMERLEELDRQFGAYSREQEEDYQRNLRGIQDNTFGNITGGVGGLAEGGITSLNPQNYMDTVAGVYGLAGEAPPVKRMDMGGDTNFGPTVPRGFGLGPGTTGPGMAQDRLRGSEVITPQDLEGYRPGIDPEIMYFRNPEPATPPGGADTSAVMAGMTGYIPASLRAIAENPFNPSKRAEALDILNRESVSLRKRKAAQKYLDENPLEDLTDSDVASMRYGESYGMQAGGETNAGMEKMLVDQTAMALMGRLSEEETDLVIKRFIDEFGIEAFQSLRSQVLEGIVPGSQKEGLIRGQGGGMDDMIPGMIGDQQPVAVSPGEFIVPGDVVSGLGDGDSSAGAAELDAMMDRVRMERTGTTRQPAPIQARAGGILPA